MMKEESAEQRLARQIIEHTNQHLFLTGRAGTGKTTFLRRIKERGVKRMVVLAPTGIAAINAGGSTIHSFLQLKFGPFIPNGKAVDFSFQVTKRKLRLIRSLDLIVIDEISMVRADLLDEIDAALRFFRHSQEPFGGVQMLLIGDLQQLPPVAKDEEWQLLRPYYATPYFFSARVLQQVPYATLEFQHVYRQSDTYFLGLLGSIRTGRADAQTLAALNERYVPDFTPPRGEGYIRLVTHNAQADRVNNEELAALDAPKMVYRARVSGTFPESAFPTEQELTLKRGAQVMFIKNNAIQGYYNGMLGEVLDADDEVVRVRPIGERSNEVLDVCTEQWENTRYTVNERTGKLEESIEGCFSQIPLRLAWAITVHKSQGLTFDRAMIDVSSAFTHGQTYVALSRCRTLEGMVLTSPLPAHAIINDATVGAFSQEFSAHQPQAEQVEAWSRTYTLQLLEDLFLFHTEQARMGWLIRVVEEHLYKQYPRSIERLKAFDARMRKEVCHVGEVFCRQAATLLSDADTLNERLQKAATYFLPLLTEWDTEVEKLDLPSDNKEVSRKLEEARRALVVALLFSRALLLHIKANAFDLTDFLPQRARLLVITDSALEVTASRLERLQKELLKGLDIQKKIHAKEKSALAAMADSEEVELSDLNEEETARYAALRAWRLRRAEECGVRAYVIAKNSTLLHLAVLAPQQKTELKQIKGIGPRFLAEHADSYLEEIQQICSQQP